MVCFEILYLINEMEELRIQESELSREILTTEFRVLTSKNI